MSVEVFCCYARKDQTFLNDLKSHLNPLQYQGLINIWNDTDISPGMNYEEEIGKHLNTANIILLLISPDFIASKYCYSKELQQAMARHNHGDAQVIPIILRPVIWQQASFGKLQALPTNGKPITRWSDPDEAFLDVAYGIVRILREEGALSPQEAGILDQIDEPTTISPLAEPLDETGRADWESSRSLKQVHRSYKNMYEVKVLRPGYAIWTGPGRQKASGTITLIRGKYNIIVDTGNPIDKPIILKALKNEHLDPKDIHYVICTHGHSDHVSNNNLFPRATFIFSYDISVGDDYTFHNFTTQGPYRIDENIEVVHTPGHTAHDVSVIVKTAQGIVAVTGDLFECADDIQHETLWRAFAEFPEDQLRSRQRILDIADYIVPGHGDIFTNPKSAIRAAVHVEEGSGSTEDDTVSENTTSSEHSDANHPPQVSHYLEENNDQ